MMLSTSCTVLSLFWGDDGLIGCLLWLSTQKGHGRYEILPSASAVTAVIRPSCVDCPLLSYETGHRIDDLRTPRAQQIGSLVTDLQSKLIRYWTVSLICDPLGRRAGSRSLAFRQGDTCWDNSKFGSQSLKLVCRLNSLRWQLGVPRFCYCSCIRDFQGLQRDFGNQAFVKCQFGDSIHSSWDLQQMIPRKSARHLVTSIIGSNTWKSITTPFVYSSGSILPMKNHRLFYNISIFLPYHILTKFQIPSIRRSFHLIPRKTHLCTRLCPRRQAKWWLQM